MSSSWQFIAIYCESLCRCFNLKSLDVNRGMQRQFVFCQWQKGFISSVFLLFFSFANKISLLPSCISFLVIVLSSFSTTMFLILYFSLCWPLLLPKLICSTSSLSCHLKSFLFSIWPKGRFISVSFPSSLPFSLSLLQTTHRLSHSKQESIEWRQIIIIASSSSWRQVSRERRKGLHRHIRLVDGTNG